MGANVASESALAKPLPARLVPGMLCICDRVYLGFESWQQARSGGAELVWRLEHNAVFRVEERLPDGSLLSRLNQSPNDRRTGLPGGRVRMIESTLDELGRLQAAERCRLATTIMNPQLAAAEELVALYAKRRGSEIGIWEVTVSQGRPRLVLRSRKPDTITVRKGRQWLLGPGGRSCSSTRTWRLTRGPYVGSTDT